MTLSGCYDCAGAFHFVDPPYINSDCGHYAGLFGPDDMQRLIDLLSAVKGKFMLTMFPYEPIEAAAGRNGWTIHRIERTISASKVKMKNQYLQMLERFDEGLYKAEAKDAELGRANWLQSKKELAAAIAAKEKADKEQARYEAEQAAKAERQAVADALANRKQDEVERANKVRESQGWSRINSAGSGKGSGGKENPNQIIIDANPNDPEAQKDQFGNSIRVFDLPKGDIVRYAEAAMGNKEFMGRHPGLVLGRPDQFGKGEYKYAAPDVIARAYFKELYNNQWEESSEGKGPVLGGRWEIPAFLKNTGQVDGLEGFWEN